MCVYIYIYIKYIRRRDDDLTQASLCIFAYHNIHLIETAGLFIYNKRPSRKRLFVFIVYISLSLSWKEKEFLSSYQIFVSGKIQKYINSKKRNDKSIGYNGRKGFFSPSSRKPSFRDFIIRSYVRYTKFWYLIMDSKNPFYKYIYKIYIFIIPFFQFSVCFVTHFLFLYVSFVNDPSAGSPTETLLRLLLPLNDQVWSSSR